MNIKRSPRSPKKVASSLESWGSESNLVFILDGKRLKAIHRDGVMQTIGPHAYNPYKSAV